MVSVRIVVASVLIGALVALVAMLSINVVLPWGDALYVPDASRDQLASIAPMALDDKLRSGEIKLKDVRGAEKIVYLSTHNPSVFVLSWAYFFIPSVVAAFLGGLFSRHRSVA